MGIFLFPALCFTGQSSDHMTARPGHGTVAAWGPPQALNLIGAVQTYIHK